MVKYKVTPEMNTPIWKSILRFFKLYKNREEFYVLLLDDCFDKNDIIALSPDRDLKVLGKIKPKREFKLDPRLNFLKDPIIQFCILILIGLACTGIYIYKMEKKEIKPVIKQIKSDAPLSEIRRDTTEWRKQYYDHLYWN